MKSESWVWPVAYRAWVLFAAILAAAPLRTMVTPRSHLVTEQELELFLGLAWLVANSVTALACSIDVASARGTGVRWGSAALGAWCVAALALQGALARGCPGFTAAGVALLASGLLGLVGCFSDQRVGRARAVVLLVSGVLFFGISVPMCTHGPCEAPRAKAMQDLDTIRNAVALHDAQNTPLSGYSLQPLLGRYLQEVPLDSWDSSYVIDTSVGVLASFGADRKPGGTDDDADVVIHYKPQLRLKRARLEGPPGPPVAGMRLLLQFNKPFRLGGDPRRDVSVVTDPRDGGSGACLDGTRATPGLSWGAAVWALARDAGGTDERSGRLVFRCTVGDPRASIRLGRDTSLDVGPAHLSTAHEPVTGGMIPANLADASSLHEVFVPGSFLDPRLYGPGVIELRPATGLELVGGQHRGVPLELTAR